MTTPVPARAHANMSVAPREFTFDALLAEFDQVEAAPDTAPAPEAAAEAVAEPAPQKRSLKRLKLPRRLPTPSAEVLKLGGLIALAALSLTLVFIALSR